jgi:pimeloyl-ACP methyl ester carboxylesterase
MKSHFLIASAMVVSGIVVGCGGGDDSASPVTADAGKTDAAVNAAVPDAGSDATYTSDVSIPTTGPTTAACATVVDEASCDKTLRPFVFVHGTYGSGSQFAHIAELLASNGYCPERIVSVEYNSLGDKPGADCAVGDGGVNTPQGCGNIDAVVTKILAANPGFTQVDMAGHSQGTSHVGTYIGLHADKIAHYVNFSGVPDVLGVQTLSLSSLIDIGGKPNHAMTSTGSICPAPGDAGVPEGGAAGDASPDAGLADGAAPEAGTAPCNVTQVTFPNMVHYTLSTSKDSFIQVYRFLNGKDPRYTDVQCGPDPVTVEGIAETFADNVPVPGKVEVRAISSTPRPTTTPDMVLTLDAKGHFAAQLKRNVFYEFAGYDATGKLTNHQYFTPFKRTNRLVRFLSPSSSKSSSVGALIAASSTDKATKDPNSSTIVVLWAGGAFRQDLGASLKVNGTEVLTPENAGATALMNSSLGGGVSALFMEDKNKNGKTDLGLVDSAAFIAFTDVFIDAKTPNLVELTFTPGSEDTTVVDQKAVFSNWPSTNQIINLTFQ